jgi:VWFA-related protein
MASVCCFSHAAISQQTAVPSSAAGVANGAVTSTVSAAVSNSTATPARGSAPIQLDVVVTDKSGNPVQGLGMQDFLVLDGSHPTKVDSLEPGDPPSQIVLVLDAVNMDVVEVTFVRQEFQNFLRQNDGKLAVPVSIILFTGDGMKIRPAITDGNKLAAELDQVQDLLRRADLINGANGDISKFQVSMKWLTTVVKNEAREPGRKLMIWGGPGWPALDGPDFTITSKVLESEFKLIVDLSTSLRQGRISLYSISPALKQVKNSTTRAASQEAIPAANKTRNNAETFNSANVDYSLDSGPFAFKSFLKGVKKVENATPPHLGLKVLATQSGGLVLGPGNNLVEQMNQCMKDALWSYKLSFAPPVTEKANEYHELKVEVSKKNLVVRTDAGYYDQPKGQ